MASRTPKAVNGQVVAPAGKADVAAADATFAFSQDQLNALIGLTDVMFKGAEEIRRSQMQAAHTAHELHERKQAEVAKARSTTDLVNVQAELLQFDIEAASKYWQQLAAICTTTQAEAMSVLTRSAAAVGGGMTKLMSQPAVPTAARKPQAEPQDTTHLDPTQAWNQWVDFGKQWTEMLYRNEAALH